MNTVRGVFTVQRQAAGRVDGQIDAICIDQGIFMQPCDGGRARDGQRAGALARGIAHFAVAQDIVLVEAGDLLAAHPHGVGSNGRPGDDDGVGGVHVVGVLNDLAVAAELAARRLLDHQRVAEGDDAVIAVDGYRVAVGGHLGDAVFDLHSVFAIDSVRATLCGHSAAGNGDFVAGDSRTVYIGACGGDRSAGEGHLAASIDAVNFACSRDRASGDGNVAFIRPYAINNT